MPHAAMLHAVQQSRLFRHQVWPCTFLTPLRNFGLRIGHGHKERHESSRRRIIARSHLYLYYTRSLSIYFIYIYIWGSSLGELSGRALWESSPGELSQRALWGALWESSLQSMNQINEPNQSLKSEHCPKEAFWTMVIFRINESNR